MAASANPNRAWEALTPPMSKWILDAVSSMNFKRMTPVQASTIPLFMAHKDVVVEAVTGSGKTLAFLIPIVERLLRLEDPIKKHHVGAIVISPTRELATQIYGVLRLLLAFHGPSAAAIDPPDEGANEPAYPSDDRILKVVPQLLVGGDVTPAQDLSHFLKKSPNFLISTPGRLLELLQSPHVHCPQSSFEVLVLDEADRLLDLGFKNDLQKILGRLPKQRRTGLFSASVSEAVDQIIRVGLRNPVKIAVKVKSTKGAEDRRTPTSLQLSYLVTRPSHKLPALSRLLAALSPTPQKTIVYLSTCAAVDYFQHILPVLLPSSFALLPLHGKHLPKVRQKNFSAFVDAVSPSILLTTDVAARGLDVREVDLVVQLDPPADPKVFLHRCGRAGRAGRRGLAVVFLHPGREERYVEFLAIRKTPVERLAVPHITVDEAEAERACHRIRQRVLEDRATHDKAQRAFVSWVRAYRKHQASSIFRVEELEWGDLAKGWGLLKLPRMPELKGREAGGGVQNTTAEAGGAGTQVTVDLGVDVDFNTYAYRDRHRELARLTKASASSAPREPCTIQSANQPWSQRISQKSVREQRREKKRTRREKEAWSRKTEKEKDEARELEGMVEAVRRKVKEGKRLDGAEKEGEGEEFGGFD